MTYFNDAEIVRVTYFDGADFDRLHHGSPDAASLAATLSAHDRGPLTDERADRDSLVLFDHDLPCCGTRSEHRLNGVTYLLQHDPELGFAALYRNLRDHPRP